jgi:hypothetical protein
VDSVVCGHVETACFAFRVGPLNLAVRAWFKRGRLGQEPRCASTSLGRIVSAGLV